MKLFWIFLLVLTQASCNKPHVEQKTIIQINDENKTFKTHQSLPSLCKEGFMCTNTKEGVFEKLQRNINPNKETIDDICFVEVKEGCGLVKNRLLISDNGRMFCARYRDNEELIEAEYFAYLISTLLGIRNVPVAIPVKVDPTAKQWSAVWKDLALAQWRPQAVVIVTEWIPSLQAVTPPAFLCPTDKPCLDVEHMKNHSVKEDISFLLQWSDLVVFDYITGNLDRMVSHLHSLQWDNDAMKRPVHNLMQDKSGILWFIDNEASLMHSYRLMTNYQSLHWKFLQWHCIFRQSTIENVLRLSKSDSISNELKTLSHNQYLIHFLSLQVVNTLRRRLHEVSLHVQSICKVKEKFGKDKIANGKKYGCFKFIYRQYFKKNSEFCQQMYREVHWS